MSSSNPTPAEPQEAERPAPAEAEDPSETPPPPVPAPASLVGITRDTELPRVLRGADIGTGRAEQIALAVLLTVSFLVAAWLASSLWVGITLGTVTAFTVQPVYRRLAHKLGERRGLSAAILTLATGLIGAGAVALFLYLAVSELVTIATLLEQKLARGTLSGMIGEPASRLIDKMGLSRGMVLQKIHEGLAAGATSAAGWAAAVVQAASGAVLGLIVALLTMYYVLLEWRTLIVRLERVLPLNPRHTRALILEFREVGRGVLVGTLATAVVQGALAEVAYAVLGVPEAATWGVATAFASFLPVVGTGLVWAPVGVYLIMNGRVLAGVAVLVWGFLVVMTATDYVIRPRLVGRRVGHPLLVLLALLGGIQALGLAGLIIAPILMSLFLAVLRIYERERIGNAVDIHEADPDGA